MKLDHKSLAGTDLAGVLYHDDEFRIKVTPEEQKARFNVEERLRGSAHPDRQDMDRKQFTRRLYEILSNESVDHKVVVDALERKGHVWMAANYAHINEVPDTERLKIAAVRALLTNPPSYGPVDEVQVGYSERKYCSPKKNRRQAIDEHVERFGLRDKLPEIVEEAFEEVTRFILEGGNYMKGISSNDPELLGFILSYGVKRKLVEERGLEIVQKHFVSYSLPEFVSALELPAKKVLKIMEPAYKEALAKHEEARKEAVKNGGDPKYVCKPTTVENYEKIKQM